MVMQFAAGPVLFVLKKEPKTVSQEKDSARRGGRLRAPP
jgi:hypothetical protein